MKFVQEDKHFCRYYDGIFILFYIGLRICEFFGLTVAESSRRIIKNRTASKVEQIIKEFTGFLFLDKNAMPAHVLFQI